MFKGLLDAFREIEPTHQKANETMFEICGFPHYEGVVSNVLAFFFDDNNNHHLNGLLAKSLVEAAGIQEPSLDLQFEVQREVRTGAGKFIDLLLSNDSFCIVIENKIWAPLYNDLDDYMEHAKKSCTNLIKGIVLSMWEVDPGHHDYVNVTYSNFINKIRDNLGHFVGSNKNQHLFLLLDLLNSLENLYERGISMNTEFISFVRENLDNVSRFGKELKAFHDDLRKIVKQVNNLVIELNQDQSLEQYPWRCLPELFDVAVTDFKIENGVGIAIDSRVDTEKWEFQVFIRNNPGINLSLYELCSSKGLKGNLESGRFILSETLPLETDPTDVAQKITNIIKSLKS